MSWKPLKTLVFVADWHGCFHARVRIPLNALMKYRLSWTPYHFSPNTIECSLDPNLQYECLVNMINSFDLVIVQRTYLLGIFEKIKKACELLGKPLIFETDDDYLSIIPSNPAYFAIADQNLFNQFCEYQSLANKQFKEGKKQESEDNIKRANDMLPSLMESRKRGEFDYIEILKNADAVTTSTQELANTIYPHNKRIGVFRNNVAAVFPWKLHAAEHLFHKQLPDGSMTMDYESQARFGIYVTPDHALLQDPQGRKVLKRTPRIGYTCTSSHFGEDWNTVKDGLNNVAAKYPNQYWYVFFEDKPQRFTMPDGSIMEDRSRCPFTASMTAEKTRILNIPPSGYDLYIANLQNIDIGIAPLYPNSFNLSKSDIKAVEYASWGIAPLLPNFRTYSRSFIHEKTALLYNNEKEFETYLEMLMTNRALREEIGRNALEYVATERLAHLDVNTEPRYKFYQEILEDSRPLRIYS